METFCAGSPGFTAPEVLSFEPHGLSSDIWSIASVAYCLLTGSPPLWDDDRATRDHLVCTEALNLEGNPRTAKLSPLVKDLLQGMLTKSPA